MEFDLEKALKETVAEYKRRIAENPDLSPGDWTAVHSEVEGINYFEKELTLIRQMREAYGALDKARLNKVTQVHNSNRTTNSVTYNYYLEGARVQDATGRRSHCPFYAGNETSSQHLATIFNAFKKVAQAGEQTELYKHLAEKTEEYERARDEVCKEIVFSEGFGRARERVSKTPSYYPNSFDWEKVDTLQEAYREEEFKRKDKVIDLCNKLEYLFGIASRLYEALTEGRSE